MEELKWSYMLAYVDRVAKSDLENNKISTLDGESSDSTPQRVALHKCSKIVLELEEEARAWYAEDIHLDKYQLMEMLLVDGCFILELLYRHNLVNRERVTTDYNIPVEDALPFRSLAGNSTMMSTLRHDLFLIENQIPYVILQQLYDVMPKPETARFVHKFLQLSIFGFFQSPHMLLYTRLQYCERERYGKHKNDERGTYLHLLDSFHHACNFPLQIQPIGSSLTNWGFKRCAAELFKSGIQFIPDNDKTIVDISFSEGRIYIPPVHMDESSDAIYRNLIAYEQTSVNRYAITSYVKLMSTFIRSSEDAYILEQARILNNKLDDVSGFFENLCKEVVFEDFCYANLCEKVENYHIPPWGRHRVNGYFIVTCYRWKKSVKDLKQEYFPNRWSIIVFLAATFVIALSVLQTFYTVRAYYPK